MKNQLADAYQGGLANIVNASGGNAATVLGNLGQLEQAKTKGPIVGFPDGDDPSVTVIRGPSGK